MYKEAQTLSEEVLELYPDDEAAKANAKAAKNSLAFRSKAAGMAIPVLLLVTWSTNPSPDIAALALPPCLRASSTRPRHPASSFRGAGSAGQRLTWVVQEDERSDDVNAARALIFDDEEDEDDLRDQEGDDDDDEDSDSEKVRLRPLSKCPRYSRVCFQMSSLQRRHSSAM
jgi:hypothetical protein